MFISAFDLLQYAVLLDVCEENLGLYKHRFGKDRSVLITFYKIVDILLYYTSTCEIAALVH